MCHLMVYSLSYRKWKKRKWQGYLKILSACGGSTTTNSHVTYVCLGWPCAIVRNMSGYGFLDNSTAFKFEMTLAILNIV